MSALEPRSCKADVILREGKASISASCLNSSHRAYVEHLPSTFAKPLRISPRKRVEVLQEVLTICVSEAGYGRSLVRLSLLAPFSLRGAPESAAQFAEEAPRPFWGGTASSRPQGLIVASTRSCCCRHVELLLGCNLAVRQDRELLVDPIRDLQILKISG